MKRTILFTKNIPLLLLGGLALLLFPSCTPQWMFQEKELAAPYTKAIPSDTTFEHILQPDDKITISVWGHEDLEVGSIFDVYSSTEASGKYLLIDLKGEVTLPLVNTVKLSGLTVREANLLLEGRYAQFLNDPIIHFRVLSHQVTILGEVRAAGNFPIEKERMTLLEAIGEAGGFSDFADLSRVTIIRSAHLAPKAELVFDFTDKETLYTSDMVLRDKDIIYVPERRAKEFAKKSASLVPVVGLMGSAALLISLLAK